MSEGGAGERDPFEGLVLDENFVKGGTYEAPARTREAIAKHKDTGWRGDARAATVPSSPERRRQGRSRRRGWTVGVAVVVLAAAGVGVGVAATRPGGDRAHLAGGRPTTHVSITPAPSPSTTQSTTELSNQTFAVGGCYTWDQSTDATNARQVACTAPHLFQAVAAGTLRGPAAKSGAPYPSDAALAALIHAVCDHPVQSYLGYTVTPASRFHTGGITPVPAGWATGDRRVECGVQDGRYQTAAQLTAARSTLSSFTGDARHDVRWWTPAPGTCAKNTRADGEVDYVTVPCTADHLNEYVGQVRLQGTTYPSPDAQARQGAALCQPIASAYAGHLVEVSTASSYLSVDTIDAASWAEGDRLAACIFVHVAGADRVPTEVAGSIVGPA